MAAIDVGFIAQVYSSVTTHAMSLAPRLQEAGGNLLLALAVIHLSWRVGKQLLNEAGPGEYLATIVHVGLIVGIIKWVIGDISYFSTALLDGFDWIAARLTGTEDGGTALTVAMGSLLRVAQNLWESMSGDVPGGGWNLMQNFFAAGASFFVRLGILLVLLLVAAITAGYFIVSQVLAGIAIALGPVFLPWLLIERLSFIANGWIKFLVTAGVMKVVGVVMLSFGSAMTDSLAQVGRAMSGQENAQVLDLVGASVTLFVSIVMLMLSMQIPSIANGLVSGSVGSGLIFPRMPKPAGGGGNAPPKPPSKK